VVTSTDLQRGLGSRIRQGGRASRQLYLSHRSRRPGKTRTGPDPHPGPRRCPHRVLRRGKRRGARDRPRRLSAVAGTADDRGHPQRHRHGAMCGRIGETAWAGAPSRSENDIRRPLRGLDVGRLGAPRCCTALLQGRRTPHDGLSRRRRPPGPNSATAGSATAAG